MVRLIEARWVEEHLGRAGVRVLDARPRMRYLQGHVQGAVNLPATALFDAQARLLSVDALAQLLGNAGLDNRTTPVIYDGYDGQSGAMLAWALEYLGQADVHLMQVFWERWAEEGRAVFYREVTPQPGRYVPRVNPNVRASAEDILSGRSLKAIDMRSREEYSGELDVDGRPGHLPGAVNIAWRDLVSIKEGFLAASKRLERLLRDVSVQKQQAVVTYCRSGPRAAVGYVVLQHVGYQVRLFDGSYAEWVRKDLPVERMV